MNFVIDKHTKKDLNIFPDTKEELSIYGYYNITKTEGGNSELKQLMNYPTHDPNILFYRLEAIKFIQDEDADFDFNPRELDFIEYYLNQNIPALKDNYLYSLYNLVSYKLRPNNEYNNISKGLEYLKALINKLSKFIEVFRHNELPEFISQIKLETKKICEANEFAPFLNAKQISFRQINKYDRLIRERQKEMFKKLLKLVYLLDAFTSVAKVSKQNALSYPSFVNSQQLYFEISGAFHPLLNDPVSNDIRLSGINNLCFVSGANMAGKSTFLKTIGVCVYLSHIGFPVPARGMKISAFHGLFTTINISDNIGKGYSHYYSEVKRVKDTVLMIKEKKRVCVIFDELFRGTNVKDAFDATFMITSGFTKIKKSLFFVSTHIVEVAKELEKLEGTVFKYFDSSLDGETPIYNYKLKDGISSERLGLTIVKNEKIIEIINEIVNAN